MNRWIAFPPDIVFYDPITKNPILRDDKKETLSFKDFLNMLMMNPIWSGGYTYAVIQDQILKKFDLAVGEKGSGMWISEDEWRVLELCARESKMLVVVSGTPQLVSGFGKHPSMARQFLSMQRVIVEAKNEAETQAGSPQTITKNKALG